MYVQMVTVDIQTMHVNSIAPETQCRMASISTSQPVKSKNMLQIEITDPSGFSQVINYFFMLGVVGSCFICLINSHQFIFHV